MPAKSLKQQRFMGMVHAYKTGKLPKSKASPQIVAAAKSITDKAAKEFAMSKSALVFDKLARFTLPGVLKSKKFKEIATDAMGGFVAGSVGSAIPTMLTYPIDTQNIREQSGMPPAKTLKEKYKGADTKLFKTIASIGLTFALANPLQKAITSAGKTHPKALTGATMLGLAALTGLGMKINNKLKDNSNGQSK